MNTQEQIKSWHASITATQVILDKITALFGYGSEATEGVGQLMESYTESVSRSIGDKFGTLEWFWLENDMGKNGHHAGVAGNLRPIRNLDDLIWLVEVNA